ncbi:MAG TPA: TlpA disulfide reductase family protein [Tepidisphaeraceae bacterium]|nr:TlpA disulfide reductase family protein [Tepidisphaeraceae bacterium]
MKSVDRFYKTLAVLVIAISSVAHAQQSQSPASHSSATSPADVDRAEQTAFRQATSVFEPAMDASDNGQPVDFEALRKAMDQFWSQFPDGHKSATLLTFYMDMFAKAHPDRVQQEWANFVNSASPVASELARGKVRFLELSRQPVDFSFTALDGRKVSLSQLRGKVVLIDFWATWCAPCVADLPAIKQIYSNQHEQGFEIFGVSLGRPEDRLKLINMVAQQKITWPQYCDEKVWQSEIVMRYAVNSAPMMFLLNQEGKIVEIFTETAGLENRIKQLLSKPTTRP